MNKVSHEHLPLIFTGSDHLSRIQTKIDDVDHFVISLYSRERGYAFIVAYPTIVNGQPVTAHHSLLTAQSNARGIFVEGFINHQQFNQPSSPDDPQSKRLLDGKYYESVDILVQVDSSPRVISAVFYSTQTSIPNTSGDLIVKAINRDDPLYKEIFND